MDLVVIVDTSDFTSTADSLEREVTLKSFLRAFLEGSAANIDTGRIQVAFITYSTHPNVVFDLGQIKRASTLIDAIEDATFTPGERNTADALSLVRTKVLRNDRPNVPNVMLLISTGKSNRNSERTLQEADALKYARTNIFAIGINLNQDGELELNGVASKPTAENTFLLSSFYEMDIMKDVLFNQIFSSKYTKYYK